MVTTKTKTYTRTIFRVMTREEVQGLFKRAHEYCKNAVKPSRHEIGGTFGGTKRKVIARDKRAYMDCIKSFIDQEVAKRLGGA